MDADALVSADKVDDLVHGNGGWRRARDANGQVSVQSSHRLLLQDDVPDFDSQFTPLAAV
jgi:hypothetical protein